MISQEPPSQNFLQVHLATFTPRHNSSERKVAVKTVYNNNFNEEDVMREVVFIRYQNFNVSGTSLDKADIGMSTCEYR